MNLELPQDDFSICHPRASGDPAPAAIPPDGTGAHAQLSPPALMGPRLRGGDKVCLEEKLAAWPFGELARGSARVIYADPPWRFEAWSHRGEDRGAVQHYPCLSLAELCALPVAELVAPDAALFLWVVQPMLPEALQLIGAWGFRFKTVAFAWVKIKGRAERDGQARLFYAGEDVRLGLGYHTRSGFEQCWLATRGKGYARESQGEPQVLFAPLREHSRKPDAIAESIVNLTGDVPRVELFARTTRPGWMVWGNQTEKFGECAA